MCLTLLSLVFSTAELCASETLEEKTQSVQDEVIEAAQLCPKDCAVVCCAVPTARL